MQVERKEKSMKKIVEIRHIVELSESQILNHVVEEVDDMQNKGLEVDVQYAANNGRYTTMLIGRKEIEKPVKKNESSKAIR